MSKSIEPTADSTEYGARCHCGHAKDDHWLLIVSETHPKPTIAGCIRAACGCNAYGPPR